MTLIKLSIKILVFSILVFFASSFIPNLNPKENKEIENKNQKSQESYKFGDLFLAFYIHTLDKRELSSENFLYCYYELILSY